MQSDSMAIINAKCLFNTTLNQTRDNNCNNLTKLNCIHKNFDLQTIKQTEIYNDDVIYFSLTSQQNALESIDL